jgi:peptidoglycan hydrolase CwlO-like protein
MPAVSPTSERPRRRGTLAAALAVAVATALAVVVQSAPAQDSGSKLADKVQELHQVTQRQQAVQGSIEEENARINELIARESEIRRHEALLAAELQRKQAELERATAELDRERAHLRRVRAHLYRATADLEVLLVRIYKTGDPDTISIVLSARGWADLISRSEYLSSIKEADDQVIDRVRALRDQIEQLVAQLRVTRARIRDARDAVAARKSELDKTRAAIDAQQQQLEAAKAARERTLEALGARQRALEKDLSQSSAPIPGERATLLPNGDAVPPANAPLTVKAVIAAANQINDLPYIWGGGHGSWEDSGYDCSGAVSFALHGGGLLDSPLDSTGLEFWGEPGPGQWISVFATSGHTFAFIAGLRWDTGGNGGGFGPRWHTDLRDTTGYVARHPAGL